MKLITSWGSDLPHPSEGDVEQALRAMPRGDDSVVILEKDATCYLQVAGRAGEWEVLEYQDGGLDHHYRCAQNFETETVVHLFRSFARGDDAWRRMVSWRRLEGIDDLGTPTAISDEIALGKSIVISVLVVAAVLAGVALGQVVSGILGGFWQNYAFLITFAIVISLVVFVLAVVSRQ